MTLQEKAECLGLRKNGATLQWLADNYGLTKQRSHQIVNACEMVDSGRSPKYKKVIYPAIRQWMLQNRISYCDLANMCGIHMQVVSGGLNGEHEMKLSTADALLRATGLTYEEAFRK